MTLNSYEGRLKVIWLAGTFGFLLHPPCNFVPAPENFCPYMRPLRFNCSVFVSAKSMRFAAVGGALGIPTEYITSQRSWQYLMKPQ